MAASVLIIGYVLSRFALIVDDHLRIRYNWLIEAGMVLGQVLFQWAFLWRRPLEIKWRYAIQLITVSLLGAILLVPLVAWHHLAGTSILAALVYFFAVVAVMFIDHWRRVARLYLPTYLCATWVAYRVLLLLIVLDFHSI